MDGPAPRFIASSERERVAIGCSHIQLGDRSSLRTVPSSRCLTTSPPGFAGTAASEGSVQALTAGLRVPPLACSPLPRRSASPAPRRAGSHRSSGMGRPLRVRGERELCLCPRRTTVDSAQGRDVPLSARAGGPARRHEPGRRSPRPRSSYDGPARAQRGSNHQFPRRARSNARICARVAAKAVACAAAISSPGQ